MSQVAIPPVPPRTRPAGRLLIAGLVGIVLLAGVWWVARGKSGEGKPEATAAEENAPNEAASPPGVVRLPKAAWAAAGLSVSPARTAPLAETARVTGKVSLNEDRVAHIFPLVEGRVEEVRVGFGQQVKQGDVLAVIQSKEVGQRKLELVQSRLAREIAAVNRDRAAEVDRNTQELIAALTRGATVEEIERTFRNRPIGNYRDRLVTAYTASAKAVADYDRLDELTSKGITSAKDLTAARAVRDAARATLTALLDEIKFDARQQALAADQSLREAGARVAATEAFLTILGYSPDDLKSIDPAAEGESLSHYSVVAPFDGTILTKDAVLLETVGANRQLFQIADLNTVWVVADVYERYLPLLDGLQGRTIDVHSEAVPGLKAKAKVFSTGSVVDELTRTVRLRAVAQNADGRLKPGMFVEVELPGSAAGSVLQVPESAVLEQDGEPFVFVKTGDDAFTRRDVTLGRKAGDSVEVTAGLEPGDPVVVSGGFALKSRLLAELLSED
jgi:cobalt-zinc-cadmium efflux system membrane fusion protein